MKYILKPNTFAKEHIKSIPTNIPKIFLGGSIEMGVAEDWQSKTEAELDYGVIFNPRRTDWDASWKQTPIPGEQFYEQVDWELKAQEASNFIIYNFLPDTKSPITLLELGLFINSPSKKFVCCPKDFWRYGNVKIVSELYGTPNLNFYHDYSELIDTLKICLSEWKYMREEDDLSYIHYNWMDKIIPETEASEEKEE